MSFNYLTQRQINAYNDIRCWVENNQRIYNHKHCLNPMIDEISFEKDNSQTKPIDPALQQTLKNYFSNIEKKINQNMINDNTWKQFIVGKWMPTDTHLQL